MAQFLLHFLTASAHHALTHHTAFVTRRRRARRRLLFRQQQDQLLHSEIVYGNDAESTTHILALTKKADGIYTFTINTTVTGQTHYFFTDTALPEGTLSEKVTAVKNLIVQQGELRTQTFKNEDNVPMVPGATFVPDKADLYTSGHWQVAGAQANVSGTLPVMYINTQDNAPITSKEDYISATLYVDPMSTAGCPASGTKDSPLTLTIKGRGNYTWTGFDKKPYRLKLSAKEPLLGMTKSKHFVLMAGADDNLGACAIRLAMSCHAA